MAPPPIPIDPAIHSWNSSTIPLSPVALDNFLHSPGVPEKLNSPGPPAVDVFSQDVQLPAMKHSPMDSHPLVRFACDPQDPWNPQRIGGEMVQPPAAPRYTSFDDRFARPQSNWHGYPRARSDVGSSTTRTYPIDSGFGGSGSFGPRSVRSAGYGPQSQSGQSLSGDMNDLHFPSEEIYIDNSSGQSTSPNALYAYDPPNESSNQVQPNLDLTCQFPNCGIGFKNQSEHKYGLKVLGMRYANQWYISRKHQLRHSKPFKCEVPGCSKTDGFSTNNDLERHRKSVHGIAPKNGTDRSFRCAARGCPKREKIWPRLDNFRQHCLRIHQDEDCDELVRKSVVSSSMYGYM